MDGDKKESRVGETVNIPHALLSKRMNKMEYICIVVVVVVVVIDPQSVKR